MHSSATKTFSAEGVAAKSAADSLDPSNLIVETCVALVATGLIILAGLAAGHLFVNAPVNAVSTERICALGAMSCLVSIPAIALVAKHSLKLASAFGGGVLFAASALAVFVI